MKTRRSRRLFLMLLVSLIVPSLLSQSGCAASRRRKAARNDYNQALLIQKAGRPDQAIAALERATQADPKFTAAHTLLGDLYKNKGDYEKASQSYEASAKLEPKVPSHFYNAGLMFQLLGNFQQATANYLNALQLRPTDPSANMNLGLIYMTLGDSKRSVEYLRRATSASPNSILAWTNLGVALDDAGDHPAAERAYLRALELEGDQFPVLTNYGGNLLAQRRFEDAVRVLQQAIDLRDSALANKLMGDALAMKGWQDAAIGRYERATKLDTQYVKAFNALGDTLIATYERGMQLNESLRERAIAAWKRSLTIQSNQLPIRQRLMKWDR